MIINQMYSSLIFSFLVHNSRKALRGAVVGWLDTLGYGAAGHRKAGISPSDDCKTLSVNPAVSSERKGMGSAFHRVFPGYSGLLAFGYGKPLPLLFSLKKINK